MLASIIIPVYNSGKYLEQSIKSILDQTEKDFEVLLIDDCSTDNSVEICKNIVDKDFRFRYFKMPKNSGPAATRNLGIDNSKGKYLLFIDSDDYVNPNYVRRLTEVAELRKADIVWCNFQYFFTGAEALETTSHGQNGLLDIKDYIEFYINNSTGTGCLWNKIYRKDLIENNNLRLNEKRVYGEDWDFNLRLTKFNPKVIAIPDILYNYFIRPNSNVSTTYYSCDFDSFVESHLMLEEIIVKNGDLNLIQEINERFIYNIISLLYKLFHSSFSRNEKISEYKRIRNDKNFKRLFETSKSDNKKLTFRQKVTARLLKYKFYTLAKLSLSI